MAMTTRAHRNKKRDDLETSQEQWLRVALRAMPTLAMPFLVGALQPAGGVLNVPLVLVAAALGVTISAAVSDVRLAVVASLLSAALLVTASTLSKLKEPLEPVATPPRLQDRTKEALMRGSRVAAPAVTAALTGLDSMSVVLPCAFEGNYARRTVESIWEQTERSFLKEIIVVDDGSDPPLTTLFDRDFWDRPAENRPPVKFERHNRTEGLISAKRTGGNVAQGDIIVFFDCHVKPRRGWERAFQKQMLRAGDHRTVVVPTITALDPDTWQESLHAVSKACYLMWSADFTWIADPGRDVPLMSGGLLAISRKWWWETGGYDNKMVAWGGENIDQSVRTWLCGGRIEVAEGAFVAHMWRDPKNPKTALKYPIPTKDVMRNKARAVSAWYGPFIKKAYQFPEYEWFVSGKQSIGDMSNFHEIQQKLQCRPFEEYIHRFSYVYEDGGLLPSEVFQLREKSSGRCLERVVKVEPPHDVVLAPCADPEGATLDLQLWHAAARDRGQPGAPCCSGIMNWNFLQCAFATGTGSKLQASECEITGGNHNAYLRLQGEQIRWREGHGCVTPAGIPLAHTVLVAPAESGVAVERLSKEGEGFDFRLVFKPAEGVEASCGTATASIQEASLEYHSCSVGDSRQQFRAVPMFDGYQIRTGEYCLDAANGNKVLVYICYEESVHNMNQIWHFSDDSRLVWHGSNGQRLSASAKPVEAPDVGKVVLRSCSPKRGQRFRQEAHQKGGALLKSMDNDLCLGAPDGKARTTAEWPIKLVDCDDSQRWVWLQKREQVQHAGTGLCVDSGDEEHPILYPCHEPAAQQKQRYEMFDSGIRTLLGWGDNGRKRHFVHCLDWSPTPDAGAMVEPCEHAEARGVSWEKVGARTPTETEIWQAWKQKTRLADLPLLGGEASPPQLPPIG